MGIRDLIIISGVAWFLVRALGDPFWGVLCWNWLSFMNPHRLSWGLASSLRLSMLTGVFTLLSFSFYKGRKRISWSLPFVLMALLMLWVGVTTTQALNPDSAKIEFWRFFKAILMAFVAVALIHDRIRLDRLVWVIVLSLGFYGVKGGLFTIATGGSYRVWGPPDSFIAGNNELAFALVIVLPLARYLQLQSDNKWAKRGLMALMVLSGFAIVGSYSRGAFLSGAAMSVALWFRSRRKAVLALALVFSLPLLYTFMPQEWHERMSTIKTYEQDASAMGRINAWWVAWNIAMDRPVLGGGARTFTPNLFLKYAPNPTDFHDVHSIYFEMLGEQGFVGFFLFMGMGFSTFLLAGRLVRIGKRDEKHGWASDLGAMCQTSLVGYATGGAFLGLAYWDLPYMIVVLVAAAWAIVWEDLATDPQAGGAKSVFGPGGDVEVLPP